MLSMGEMSCWALVDSVRRFCKRRPYNDKKTGLRWSSLHGGLDDLDLVLVDETQRQNSSRHQDHACEGDRHLCIESLLTLLAQVLAKD